MEKHTFSIKPCPCCGATAELREANDYRVTAVSIICLNRKCRLMMIQGGLTIEEATAKAVNMWNRREAEA